jgi:hypothetical protein
VVGYRWSGSSVRRGEDVLILSKERDGWREGRLAELQVVVDDDDDVRVVVVAAFNGDDDE